MIIRKSISLRNKSRQSTQDDSKKKNARIFLIYFTTLVYVLITTAGITDIQLILDDSVLLPIINAKVSNAIFFLLAPLIVLALFVFYNLQYEHLNLRDQNKNWPIFEFDKFPNSNKRTKCLVVTEAIFSTIFLWGIFPITLFVIAFRYLESHNLLTMWYHFTIALVGTIIAFVFWNKDRYNLRNIILSEIIILSISISVYLSPSVFLNLSFGRFINDNVYPTWNKDMKLFIFFLSYITILPISIASITKLFLKRNFVKLFKLNIWLSLCTIPLVFVHYIVYTPFGEGRNADLSYQIIAQNPESAYKGVYSVDLRFKRLENASFLSSVLNNADMRYSIFNNATFHTAELDGADLRESDLRNVTLNEAKLHSAKLEGVDLSNSDLIDADLSDANLKYANFTNCDLREANLTNAILDSTNFKGADLRGVNIHNAAWGKCLTLYDAKLDSNGLEYINTYFAHLLQKS